MSGYLIDTNIWSFLQQRKYPKLEARFAKCSPDQLYLSAIVRGELEVGFEKGDKRIERRISLDKIIKATQHLSVSPAVAVMYAKVRADLETKGTPIGGNDTWIAAEALHHHLVLITDNIREFERVAGLRVENWAE
ncbi:MAG: PIN domain-containing protein [Cytophagales bacterium]|nr:PIN domain-containing protein [Cytophagales bacterium]